MHWVLSPEGSSPSTQGSSRVRVLKKGLESESLKIWTQVRLEYTVGLEYYITAFKTSLIMTHAHGMGF